MQKMRNKKAQRTNLRTINIVVYLPCAKVIYVDTHIIYYNYGLSIMQTNQKREVACNNNFDFK